MSKSIRMPAEWEPHRATWIAWPYLESDFPGKIDAVQWVYTEIVRVLATSEKVEILCNSEEILNSAKERLSQTKISPSSYNLHLVQYDRTWLRDTAPTGVVCDGKKSWIRWLFNGWAKYDNYLLDQSIPDFIGEKSARSIINAVRSDNGNPFVCEGGASDCDGEGTLLVTEECLLSPIQERNPGLNRQGYETTFNNFLGIDKTIWLDSSCEGDDTHGHIDDVARFVSPGKVVLSFEDDPKDANHKASLENLRRLKEARDAKGRLLEVTTLPMPGPLYFEEDRLPASYANFYIANSVVIVPTFNHENDRIALQKLSELFPSRRVVGIHAVDLVLGFGTLHCLTQQEPL